MMTDEEILKAFNKKRREEIVRIVVRPKFTLYKEVFQLIIALAVVFATVCLRSHLSDLQFTILLIAEILLFAVSQTKNILLLLIFLYQKFAPRLIRAACLFTPSCSEYMRLSILKYGVFKGAKKGINRLRKCRPPNGGLDEP